MKFIKKEGYYTGIVYEWNLPTGHTCPFALECLVKVDQKTGKADNQSTAYRCYASSHERFDGVRRHRWNNYEWVKRGKPPVLPRDAKAIRIHMSGDFFNQAYFDLWLNICYQNPRVEFWAYTKSLGYWVNRLSVIPKNLVLTASKGGRQDELIEQNNLKHVTIIASKKDANGLLIDTNDNLARKRFINFALIDNKSREQ